MNFLWIFWQMDWFPSQCGHQQLCWKGLHCLFYWYKQDRRQSQRPILRYVTQNSPNFLQNFLSYRLMCTGTVTEFLDASNFRDPNFMKWSLTVNNFPYTQTGTNIALKISFESAAATFSGVSSASSALITKRPQNALSMATTNIVTTVASWDTTVSLWRHNTS